MSGFWATVWVIAKYSALIGGSFALLAIMILLFHPIYLTLSGRASLMGQRGEVKLSYLFGLLRLRYIATVHTQDVWLEFAWFKKLLQRESVVSEKVRARKNSESELKKEETPKEEKADVQVEEELKEEIKAADDFDKAVEEKAETESAAFEETEKKEVSEPIEEKQTEAKAEITEKTEEPEEVEEAVEEFQETSEISDEELAESLNDENMPRVEATPEQLAELQSILEAEEKKEEEEKKAKKSGWEAKLRKFKKDFNRRYEQLRGKIMLAKQKWNSLWPVVKRFWNRGKKGFRFHDAYLKVEYSLDEHYLTGMLCGYLAPTIGFIKSYGLDFEPVAMFPDKPGYGVYSKAAWYLDIKPYRLVWAVAGLLFEKNVYKEIYWLYKYKKEKKKNKK